MRKTLFAGIICLQLVLTSCLLTGCSVPFWLNETINYSKEMQKFEERQETDSEGLFIEREVPVTGEPQKPEVVNETTDDNITCEDEGFAELYFYNYAYDRLSASEKNWYDQMLSLLANCGAMTTLTGDKPYTDTPKAVVEKIFRSIITDHPELFYVEGYSYKEYTNGVIEFEGRYSMNTEEVETKRKELLLGLDNCISQYNGPDDPYEITKFVYDWIIENTDYDMENEDPYTVYSVLVNHCAVCQGYAKAFQYIMLNMGQKCTVVSGSSKEAVGHIWNLVNLDNEYYYVDATWGSPDSDSPKEDAADESLRMDDVIGLNEPNYAYFCMTTQDLLTDHVISEKMPLPICTAVNMNYYHHNDLYFTEFDKKHFRQLCEKYLVGIGSRLDIRLSNSELYDELFTYLMEEQHIFDYLPKNINSVNYLNNGAFNTITFWVANDE